MSVHIEEHKALYGTITQPDESLGYLRLLRELGLSPVERGIWAAVGGASRVQGWKLHLSSIPVEAGRLLMLVVPLLGQRNVSFKVAKEEMVLCQLNEGELGGTQVGKFITIYPETDDQSRELALELVDMTAGFEGPSITTDLRLGDIVYARYGNYNPIIFRDRLGQIFLRIYAPDGTLRNDSYSVPFVPPELVPNPFADLLRTEREPEHKRGIDDKRSSRLIGPGYLLVDVLKQHAKGSVFHGIDLRSQELVSAKIIKQGRRHCLSDQYGRDMRTRLQHQEHLHSVLADHPAIPKADAYFEDGEYGYLPIQFIEGESVEEKAVRSLANRPWEYLSFERQHRLLSYIEGLVIAVERLHQMGYVHHDLTASNVWIGEDDRVYLLDLELCHAINDPSPPFGLGTPGFMSTEQAARNAPAFADDIYAIGCVITLLISGMDPRRVLFIDERSRVEKLHLLTGAPRPIIEIIDHCLAADSSLRPSLKEILFTVRSCMENLTLPRKLVQKRRRASKESVSIHARVRRLIRHGQNSLLRECIQQPASGLWLSPALRNSPDHTGSPSTTAYELRRSTNRGVAGPIYLLGRLARFGYHDQSDAVHERISKVAEWLLANEPAPDAELPGLHFGDAGVAVALAEAVAGGLLEMDVRIGAFLRSALAGRLDWPDITHGAAGQGLAALYCGELLGDIALSDFSHRCASYLLEAQQVNGSWRMPQGVEGMSDQTLTGFAHGVSGIVYFLAVYAQRFGREEAWRAAELGADWLILQAIQSEDGTVLEWEYSDTNPTRWKWWCHGGPGIALTFLKLYEQTQSTVYAETARKALSVHPKDVRYGNLSQCHGLSGLGEIYLEAERLLGDDEWTERATYIARVLCGLCRESRRGSALWLVEDPYQPTADLMVGTSGLIHFFLRFALRGKEKIGFPLLA